MMEITSVKDECRSVEISLNYCLSYMSIDDINRHSRIDIERPDEF